MERYCVPPKMKPSPQQSTINNTDDYDDGDKLTESIVGIPPNELKKILKKMVVSSGHVSAHLDYSTRYMSSPAKPGTGQLCLPRFRQIGKKSPSVVVFVSTGIRI